MSEFKNEKFYNSTWFCILMLVFICPVGVVLMWKNKKFHEIGRIVVSILAVPITFIGLIFWIALFVSGTNSTSGKDLQAVSEESSKKRNEEAKEKVETKEERSKVTEEKKEDKAPKDKDTIKSYVDDYKSASEVVLNKLYRNPDQYKGKILKIQGVVSQVLQEDGYEILIVSDEITEEEIALEYKREEGQIRYLEKDYICAVVDFKGVESFSTLIGENKQVPTGAIKKVNLSDVSDAMINVSEAVVKIKEDYKLVYEDKSDYIEKLNKKVYFFKVYDSTNKCYKEEFLVTDGYNTYWYNENTAELSEAIYKRQYQ